MKTKISNLGTVINKTAQKQILGGTPIKCPGDGVWTCRGKEPYIIFWCVYDKHYDREPNF
ncbi:hypothetical protein ABHQ57_08745 [Tenacibaculum sp. ZH5_bin.1]|uniref:hypothetical protein n=1 Tax=unclassified Tenacibaculum TaxID=2635139 RepID=UPI0036E2112F